MNQTEEDAAGVEASDGSGPGPVQFQFERRVAVATAVVVVGVVLFLVLRNEPFADPSLVVMMRTVLSLAIGVLGATIPGFLSLEYTGPGWAIRAGGALALFVITFFGSPSVQSLNLRSPTVRLEPLTKLDVRSRLGPDSPTEERLRASLVATLPVTLTSEREPAARARVTATRLRLETSAQSRDLRWRYFVTMHEERYGVWLGIDGDAVPVTIDAGTTLSREILHEPLEEWSWGDFLRALSTPEPGDLVASLEVDVEERGRESQLRANCEVSLAPWAEEVRKFRERVNEEPNRITMECRSHG